MKEAGEPRVRSRHFDLSLAEVGDLLPGTGEVMARVSRLWGTCWYAAHGGNWDLASFYFRRTRTELRALVMTRPKYAEQLRQFETEGLGPVGRALLDKDLSSFKEAFEDAVEQANAFHLDTGYGYIRWRLPDRAPEAGLDLGPPSEPGA